MRRTILLTILTLLCSLDLTIRDKGLTVSTVHAAKTQPTKKAPYKIETVKTSQAAVYTDPSFDSPIITYLPKNKYIRVYEKKTALGGIGIFYRIKYKKRKYGYITDIDIYPPQSKKRSSMYNIGGDDDPLAQAFEDERSMYFYRYLGPIISVQKVPEKLFSREYSAYRTYFGLRFSGPIGFLPADVTVMYAHGVPDYYADPKDALKTLVGEVTGFGVYADASLTLPIIHNRYSLFYAGVGLAGLYRDYKITQVDDKPSGSEKPLSFQSRSLHIGGVFPVGVGFKFRNIGFKLEGKYVVEVHKYFAVSASMQWAF